MLLGWWSISVTLTLSNQFLVLHECGILHCKFEYLCIYDLFHILLSYDTLADPQGVCVYMHAYMALPATLQ